MDKNTLEKYLGKTVTIELFDKSILVGELHKTEEEQFKSNSELHLKKNYYMCLPNTYLIFRSSHIKNIEVYKQWIKK